MKILKRFLQGLGILVALLGTVIIVLIFALRHPLPEASPGPAGDELAHRVAASVGAPAWDKLGVVRWTLDGKRHYLWDKKRGFVRVTIGGNQTLVDLMKNPDGPAYKWFCNDSFWLNPLAKLFDDGTSRSAVQVDGRPALLVSYASGGVTPGDQYLWLLGDGDRPVAWRVWVSVIKFVPGLQFAWSDWAPIGSEGALVAMQHHALGLPVQRVSDLAAADRPEQLESGGDPFAALAAKR